MRGARIMGVWVLGAVVVLGLVSSAWALSAAGLFRYTSGGALEELFGGTWYPARIANNGVVEIYSGGSYYNSGYTQADLIAAGITPPAGTSSDSSGSSYDDGLAGQKQAELERVKQENIRMWREYALRQMEESRRREEGSSGGDSCSYGLNDAPSSHLALADVLAAKEGWQLTLDGKVDYSHTDFTFAPDASIDVYSAEVSALLKHDHWRIGLAVPYEQVDASAAVKAMESYRTGFNVTPSYRLLDERAEGLNLDLVTGLGYSYQHFSQASTFGLKSDSNHLDGTLGVIAGRTTAIGYLALGYLYQASYNLDYTKEANGTSRLDVHGIGVGYGVPLSRRVYATLTSVYTYTPGLAPGVDRQDLNAAVGLTCRLTDQWRVNCSASHNFLDDSARTWGIGAGVTYAWK